MPRRYELPESLYARSLPAGAPVPVLVLNVGKMVLHHGCVGIIRSLGRMGVPMFATLEDRWTPAAVSRYLTNAFIWDTRRLDAARFLKGMAMIGRRLNRPTIVIPTGDVAATLVAENAAALKKWFLLPAQPPLLPRTAANKKDLYRLCQKIGVPCARSVFPESIEDVHQFVAQAVFPVVVKFAESWNLPKGGYTTTIARTPEQLYASYQAAQSLSQPNLIFQEYIDPIHGEDWFYHCYRNMDSQLCFGFTGRKFRSYPIYAGPTTLGKSLPNEPLRQQTEALLQAISYGGIADLDYRLDHRDGQYKLLDFNPRIGAQFRLFEDEGGIDVARALYLDLTGERVPSTHGSKSRTFIAEFHDVAASFGYHRRGQLSLNDWRRSLQGPRELAWFCRDDPLPFVMMGIRVLLRVAQRLLPSKKPELHGADDVPRQAAQAFDPGEAQSSWPQDADEAPVPQPAEGAAMELQTSNVS